MADEEHGDLFPLGHVQQCSSTLTDLHGQCPISGRWQCGQAVLQGEGLTTAARSC